ncbi:hypothetical protein JCGZ_18582 [Jatropha curcas]|uniref:Uncharacterized protein n=1 Tax=Jatropha curcas TaxID=180498 RepID=A0A067KCP2_JATCU|nr:hypothetical protein JCGZ_18582 [Jatropha curcas]
MGNQLAGSLAGEEAVAGSVVIGGGRGSGRFSGSGMSRGRGRVVQPVLILASLGDPNASLPPTFATSVEEPAIPDTISTTRGSHLPSNLSISLPYEMETKFQLEQKWVIMDGRTELYDGSERWGPPSSFHEKRNELVVFPIIQSFDSFIYGWTNCLTS